MTTWDDIRLLLRLRHGFYRWCPLSTSHTYIKTISLSLSLFLLHIYQTSSSPLSPLSQSIPTLQNNSANKHHPKQQTEWLDQEPDVEKWWNYALARPWPAYIFGPRERIRTISKLEPSCVRRKFYRLRTRFTPAFVLRFWSTIHRTPIPCHQVIHPLLTLEVQCGDESIFVVNLTRISRGSHFPVCLSPSLPIISYDIVIRLDSH